MLCGPSQWESMESNLCPHCSPNPDLMCPMQTSLGLISAPPHVQGPCVGLWNWAQHIPKGALLAIALNVGPNPSMLLPDPPALDLRSSNIALLATLQLFPKMLSSVFSHSATIPFHGRKGHSGVLLRTRGWLNLLSDWLPQPLLRNLWQLSMSPS